MKAQAPRSQATSRWHEACRVTEGVSGYERLQRFDKCKVCSAEYSSTLLRREPPRGGSLKLVYRLHSTEGGYRRSLAYLCFFTKLKSFVYSLCVGRNPHPFKNFQKEGSLNFIFLCAVYVYIDIAPFFIDAHLLVRSNCLSIGIRW